MRGLDILERFERNAGAWICVEPTTIHFPRETAMFDRGMEIGSDTQIGRQLDQLAALAG